MNDKGNLKGKKNYLIMFCLFHISLDATRTLGAPNHDLILFWCFGGHCLSLLYLNKYLCTC